MAIKNVERTAVTAFTTEGVVDTIEWRIDFAGDLRIETPSALAVYVDKRDFADFLELLTSMIGAE